MYGLLLFLLVVDGILLGIVILLQAGKGGGLAAMGGGVTATEGILAGRQATTFLTRTTWITGTVFMVLALVLSIMSSRAQQPTSILREGLESGAPAPAPTPLLPGATESPPTDAETPPPSEGSGPGGDPVIP